MAKVLINGKIVDESQAVIAATDSGFLYGAGLFETMRAANSKVFAIDDHLDRLFLSGQELSINIPYTKQQITEWIDELLKENSLTDARLRLTVSNGPLGIDPTIPTILITASEFVAYPEEYHQKGVKVVLSSFRQNIDDPTCGHKTTNYLSRLLALEKARKQKCTEALWFTVDNRLAEGCISNIFLVKDGKLLTPSLETPVLPGVARKNICQAAIEQKIELLEKNLFIHNLLEADEVFLTNVIMGVLPLISVEKHTIKEGRVGKITKQLAESFEILLKEGVTMKIQNIINEIENLSPSSLAQDWDNVGLLIGDAGKNAKNAMLTIDLTREVLEEAKQKKCEMIISYHPLIWDGLKKITAAGPGSLIYDIIKSNIAVYSIHTSLDVIPGGVNDGLAKMVGIKNPQPIGDFVSMPGKDNYKLVVFIPANDVNKVADAVFKAGAGAIGNYTKCSYRSDGTGTFFPMAGSNPAIGKKGKLESVNEIKFECIVATQKILPVLAAMRVAHPYEEPAFDVIKLDNVENSFGLGRMGNLDKPRKLNAIINDIKKATGCKAVGIVGNQQKTVKKAAVCAGICGKILNSVIAAGCDLYLTGELKHHEALLAQEMGLTAICLTHSVSERFMLKKLAKKLQNPLKNVKIHISRKDKDPFVWKQV